ncbi:unnamed protein product, partial [Amoebophrya sp. A120]
RLRADVRVLPDGVGDGKARRILQRGQGQNDGLRRLAEERETLPLPGSCVSRSGSFHQVFTQNPLSLDGTTYTYSRFLHKNLFLVQAGCSSL